jgi:hypothetical protein
MKKAWKRWVQRQPSDLQQYRLNRAVNKYEYAEVEAWYAFQAGYRAAIRASKKGGKR